MFEDQKAPRKPSKKIDRALWLVMALCVVILVFVFYRLQERLHSHAFPPNQAQDIKELEVLDVKTGAGEKVERGSKVQVHYRAWLYDPSKHDRHGEEIDSSYKREKPIEVVIGKGEMVPAWDEGLMGLKTGGTRIIYSPSAKAYGTAGVKGVINHDQAIIYEVELLKIVHGPGVPERL